MKRKKLFILALAVIIFSSLLLFSIAEAADLKFKPNVPIPIEVEGIRFDQEQIVTDDGSFLAKYIVAIYTYGAGFAGIVAMFMLVIAGWRWLMAAGNAQKIAEAKSIVNGVLVGLALLFGGQLLLRQISSDFSSLQSLDVGLPESLIEDLADADFGQCAQIMSVKKYDEQKDIKCEDYTVASICEVDLCKVDGKTITEKNEDDRCVPRFENEVFTACEKCSRNCNGQGCAYYGSAFLKQADPCDCDEDGGSNNVYPDPNGCDGFQTNS